MSKNETTLWRYSVDFNTGGEGDYQYKKVIVLTAPEQFQTVCGYMQKMLGKVYSENDNEFHVLISEENDELAKSLLAEKVRARHEELKALYKASNSTLRFLEKGPREKKEQKEREDKKNFERIVLFIARTLDENKNEAFVDEIDAFEDAIENHGRDSAWFGMAKSHWNAIQIGYYSYHNPPFFSADYDGYNMCEWTGPYEEFEKLFRETAPTVYEMYQTRLSERLPESSMALDR